MIQGAESNLLPCQSMTAVHKVDRKFIKANLCINGLLQRKNSILTIIFDIKVNFIFFYRFTLSVEANVGFLP